MSKFLHDLLHHNSLMTMPETPPVFKKLLHSVYATFASIYKFAYMKIAI